MALDAATLVKLVSLLMWTCLVTNAEQQKHFVFTKVLSSQVIVEQLICSASLVIAPGLLDVFESSTPPTVSYFKASPPTARSYGLYASSFSRNNAVDQRSISTLALMPKAVSLHISSSTAHT